MKFVFQFARIVGFCLLGEILATVLPLPIPASVYGLLLMVAALRLGLLRLGQVMELGSQMMEVIVPVLIAIVPITALVMAVTGCVAQHCTTGREVQRHE